MRRTVLTLATGLLLGLGIGTTLPALGEATGAAPEVNPEATYSLNDLVFARAEGLLLSLQNIVVSLAVDTERSALEIAAANDRIGKLERRIKALEAAAHLPSPPNPPPADTAD